jgi:hypothetical protein
MDRLLAMLHSLPESEGVRRLLCEIPYFPNFFPGGRGYKTRDFPESPVMFIGHNFDTEDGFLKSVERGSEDYLRMKTWVNMKESFLPSASLDEESCFFTNFYLGAIIHLEPKAGDKKKSTNTGTFKCSHQYRLACIKALRTQVQIVRPKVVALLGNKVPPAFGEAFPSFGRYCGPDLAGTQSQQPPGGYRLQLLSDLPVQVVCLSHPANPRSLESHRAQGLLLRLTIKAARNS